MLFKRGTIKRKSRDLNKITSAILLASIDPDESFVETRIVTLREWSRDLARDEASTLAVNCDELTPLTEQLATTKYHMQQSFVMVSDIKELTIGINVDTIDDGAINEAMIMLSQVEDFSTPQIYCFGPKINTSVDLKKKS